MIQFKSDNPETPILPMNAGMKVCPLEVGRRRSSSLALVFALSAVLMVGGCRSCATPSSNLAAPTAGETLLVRTELYFGLSTPGGGQITEQQFDEFVAQVITPRFPDGLTIVDAVGQWRDPSGHISHERSKILIVLHEPGTGSAAAIEEIRAQYKSRFNQESVMRVTSTAGVAF